MAQFRFGGALLHISYDEYGSIEVVEEAGVRALHFGTASRQSAVDLSRPDRLELPYARAMLSALLFLDRPRRILMVGLGAGSLAKFFWQHYPESYIDVVEKRPAVANIAHGWFGLPEDERLRVHIADGRDFVRRSDSEAYDLILVDAYHGHGMAEEIAQHDFYSCCAMLLAPRGVLASNLWGNDPRILAQSLRLLEENFARPVLQLPVPGKGNVIGLAFHDTPSPAMQRDLKIRAKALDQELDVELSVFTRYLRRTNARWLEAFWDGG